MAAQEFGDFHYSLARRLDPNDSQCCLTARDNQRMWRAFQNRAGRYRGVAKRNIIDVGSVNDDPQRLVPCDLPVREASGPRLKSANLIADARRWPVPVDLSLLLTNPWWRDARR